MILAPSTVLLSLPSLRRLSGPLANREQDRDVDPWFCNSGDDDGQCNHCLRRICMPLDIKLFGPQDIDFPSINVINFCANRHHVGCAKFRLR